MSIQKASGALVNPGPFAFWAEIVNQLLHHAKTATDATVPSIFP